MVRNKLSPKDITGSLVHKRPISKGFVGDSEPVDHGLKKGVPHLERSVSFDGFCFFVWSSVFTVIAIQFLLMAALSFLN